MTDKSFLPWVALIIVAYLAIVRTPRYDFTVEKVGQDQAFVYRFDRFTGRIDRYASDGNCISFRKHCAFEERSE